MVGGRMSLQAGSQTRAARRVADEIPRVSKTLEDLATSVESSAPGFVGGASGGLAQALTAWFEVAGTLPTLLGAYASALAAVDTTAVEADSDSTRRLASSAAGSGPGSGLNMGTGGRR